MCDCVNVEMGSYANTVTLKAPSWSSKEFITVDKCLSCEIIMLWRNGVMTTGCCCGHNQVAPMINVADESHSLMMLLEYTFTINKSGVKCYTPKH